MPQRLLILGASVRAAAASARRAGVEPYAIDLFADVDTRRLCESVQSPFDEYPDGLFRLAARVPPMPWMYTGGLENYPDLITKLAAERPLWGNPADVLNVVRDPFTLSRIGDDLGFATPKTVPSDNVPSLPGRWLRKPLNGSGGHGIRVFQDGETIPDDSRFVIQEYLPGPAMSAIYVSNKTHCEMVGVTEQLVGEPWLHAKPFAYAGNVGPIDLGDELRQNLATLGTRLAQRTGLIGVWGIDFILNNGTPFVIEINPRYTASVEVFELASSFRAFDWLRWVFANGPKPRQHTVQGNCVGKAIYYTPRRFEVPTPFVFTESFFADIPQPGSIIEAGQPVVTLFTTAGDPEACRRQLKATAAALDRLLPT